MRYNDAQKRSRTVIERCFEILKRRCRKCVGLRNRLGKSLVIIVVVGALHNFTIMKREIEMNDVDWDDDYDEPELNLPELQTQIETLNAR